MSDNASLVLSFANPPDAITNNVWITALRIPLTA